MSAERRGLAECASSAAAFGSVGVLVALAQHEHIGTTTLLASRYVLGAIALWIALIALRHPLPGLRIAQTLGQDVPCRVHITVVLCPALGANPLPVAQGESVLTQPQALQVLELG